MKLTVEVSKKTLKKIEKLKKEIADNRDALRELIYELNDIDEGCEEAVSALDNAADAMSRLI